jgi:hypothetical protein
MPGTSLPSRIFSFSTELIWHSNLLSSCPVSSLLAPVTLAIKYNVFFKVTYIVWFYMIKSSPKTWILKQSQIPLGNALSVEQQLLIYP